MLETLFSGGQNHTVKLITIAGKDNCGHDNGACKQNLCTDGRSHIIYSVMDPKQRLCTNILVFHCNGQDQSCSNKSVPLREA